MSQGSTLSSGTGVLQPGLLGRGSRASPPDLLIQQGWVHWNPYVVQCSTWDSAEVPVRESLSEKLVWGRRWPGKTSPPKALWFWGDVLQVKILLPGELGSSSFGEPPQEWG